MKSVAQRAADKPSVQSDSGRTRLRFSVDEPEKVRIEATFHLSLFTFHTSTTPGRTLLSSALTLLKLTRSLARFNIDSTT